MDLTTLRYRIKDSTTSKKLVTMGGSCNFVWNYCNEVNQESWKKFGKPLSAFDLNKLTAGCAKELGLHRTGDPVTKRSGSLRRVCQIL